MPRPAAFFDMDRTLLVANSGTLWLAYLRRRGEISAWQIVKAALWLLEYRLALIDGQMVTREVAAMLTGQAEAELRAKCDRWFDEEVAPFVSRAAQTAVEDHRREGHVLAVLSGSSPYASEPLARRLGIPHVLCTRLVVESGCFTGQAVAPVAYGTGKVLLAEEFALRHDIDLGASWFYTDSFSDLPMLERVGHPVVVNPDFRLARHARRAGWPMRQWRV